MLYHISGKEPHGTGDGTAVSGRPAVGALSPYTLLDLLNQSPPQNYNFQNFLQQQPLANFLRQLNQPPQNPYQAMLNAQLRQLNDRILA